MLHNVTVTTITEAAVVSEAKYKTFLSQAAPVFWKVCK